jgi:Rieske Fe-S protein
MPRLVLENASVALELVGGRLKKQPGSIEDVRAGEGRIVQIDGGKIAVHRDDDGTVHAVAATCTHMGCLVGWNSAERTWDCACHGSRFGADGDVLEGPATTPLEPVDVSMRVPV